jgi:hypothetical protein
MAVLTFIVTAAGFYYVTQEQLKQHNTEIATLKAKQDASTPATVARIEAERVEREKVRDIFLANQTKTAEVLSAISNRLSINETKQEAVSKSLETTNSTLTKVLDQLQQLNAPARRP